MFERDDRVQLSNIGIANKDSWDSPEDPLTLGRYIFNDGDEEGDQPHEVRWDDGSEANYNAEDLIKVNP